MKIISKESNTTTETIQSSIKSEPLKQGVSVPARETVKEPAKSQVKPPLKQHAKPHIKPQDKPQAKAQAKPQIKHQANRTNKNQSLNVKNASPKSNVKAPPDRNERVQGQSYLSTQYDRFVSLLRFNITFKLTLGYAIRLLFLIAFLFFFIYVSFSYFLFYNAQENLKNDSTYVTSILERSQNYEDESIEPFLESNGLEFYVFDVDHNVLHSSSDAIVTYETATSMIEYDFRNFPQFPTLYETRSLIFNDNSMIYFTLKTTLTSQTNTLEATFPIGFVLCFVLILSSIRSASKMANKHLKPILIMTEQVKDMSANNLSTRLNVSGTKDELKDLALTFNQMLNDIQKSYEREKQFVSDASHELRTPIAVIKGYAGMLNRWGKDDPAILEESIHAILGETDNMHSLVESLLFIARNDKGSLKMDKVAFSFTDLFTEIVKETRLIDTQHNIKETIDSGIMIHGSADKLKQALRIFIDNSIKYTPDAGNITLSVRKSEHHTIVVISDDGIGISKEDLPNIFDRFYRADKSRTKMKENQHGGTGLGLSIAKIIIEQHGGKIHVDSVLNEGTTFTLFLPIHNVPDALTNDTI